MAGKYVGIQTHIIKNEQRILLMLVLFSILVVALVWIFFLFLDFTLAHGGTGFFSLENFQMTSFIVLHASPWMIGICLIWFLVAYLNNVRIIKRATRSKTLPRMDNTRIYNLAENLCMVAGMPMPKENCYWRRIHQCFCKW